MPNFKSLQSLLGVPSSFEDEEELYSKMPTKEEEIEAYTSTPKWSAEQYKQSITPKHREELERQQKARERTEEFEKPLEEDVGPLGALGYHVLKNIAFDERPASEFEEGGGSVYESTSPIDFITPAGVGATAKGISKAFTRPGIRKAVVSEVLPATRFEKIKQAIPSSTIEGKVVTPQLAAEERLALPAPVTEEPLGLPMPKQELPAPSTKSIEAMPIAESPAALERAVDAETPAIISSKPIARAKKSAVSQEPEPDRFVIPGMFLKTEQLIRQKMGKSASPQQIMGVLREAKPEELEYLRIPEFLEGQDKVTKEALLEHIKKSSPHLEEIPAKTLGFEVEQERLLEREALLREEADNFDTLTDDRDYLRNTLQKSGYRIDEALDIIDDLEGGSTEALQIFKNISPYQGESAELYLDNYLQHSSIIEELGKIGKALRTISTKDFPPPAKYYKLPSAQNLILEHPKSRETYKEKLYSISRPHPEIRDGRKMTAEAAKIYDFFETKIKEETKRHEELEKSFEIPKESFEKYENANARNREIEEPFKNALIKDFDTRYPRFIGTHLHQDSINFHINKRILEKLNKALTVESKLLSIDNMDISEDLKRFYKENILSNEEYLKNLKIIKNHQYYIDHATEELMSSQTHINNIKNHRDRFIRETDPQFLESHWAEPNVFSHTRSTEFTAPNGERHLFAQELQSDWHQKVRDRNKKLQNLEKKLELAKLKGQNEKYNSIKHEINRLKFDINKMPKAPMSRTWHEFLTKRLLTDAAEGNFDNISWTTGDTQNKRYSLERFFSKINYNPETLDLVTFNLDGQVISDLKVSPEDLPDYIGEELSKKLLSTKPFESRYSLSGEELKTGGEGMRGFYDEIIPSTMAKFGKKYGVKPEKVTMPDVGEIWTMKLTPEMKEYIKKYGFPMFMLPGFMQQEEVPEEKKEFKNINKLVKDKK